MTAPDIRPFQLKWTHSFLSYRTQSVNVGKILSDWVTLNGGMPQGYWLGPYVFLVFLIFLDDLNTITAPFKFVDDVAQTETIDQSHTNSHSVLSVLLS